MKFNAQMLTYGLPQHLDVTWLEHCSSIREFLSFGFVFLIYSFSKALGSFNTTLPELE